MPDKTPRSPQMNLMFWMGTTMQDRRRSRWQGLHAISKKHTGGCFSRPCISCAGAIERRSGCPAKPHPSEQVVPAQELMVEGGANVQEG